MISVAALEQAARELQAGNAHGPWEWQGGYPQRITNPAAVVIADCFENPDMPAQTAPFIAAADPASVLALVEATRAAERVACLPLPMSSDERVEWLTALEQLRQALGRFSFTDGTE